MKVLKIFSLFTVIALFIGCSSDDDNSNNALNQENLINTYKLEYFHRQEIKTTKEDGFETTTTTTQKGDTYGVTYDFTDKNKLIKDGNFQISETKQRDKESRDSTFIQDFRNEEFNYVLNEDDRELTIGQDTYEISHFNEEGFRLNLRDHDTIKSSNRKTVIETTEEIELVR